MVFQLIRRTTQIDSSSSIWCAVCCLLSASCCCLRQQSLWRHDNRFTTHVQMYQLFHPPQKKIGSSDPLHILQRVSYGWPPKTLKFSRKSDEWFLRNFLKPKIFCQSSPFTGGPDTKILILSTQRPPTAQKISSPPDLLFWRYKGWKFQLSHLFPQNWAARSPPYFAQSFIGMTPKNPESFVTVSRTVSEIFGILLSDPVAYLKKETTRTESLDTPPQCKGVICHPSKTAKIIVFDPMKYISPNVPLQDELLTWTSQLRTGQPSIFAIPVWHIAYCITCTTKYIGWV